MDFDFSETITRQYSRPSTSEGLSTVTFSVPRTLRVAPGKSMKASIGIKVNQEGPFEAKLYIKTKENNTIIVPVKGTSICISLSAKSSHILASEVLPEVILIINL